jgi:hypothetical protein
LIPRALTMTVFASFAVVAVLRDPVRPVWFKLLQEHGGTVSDRYEHTQRSPRILLLLGLAGAATLAALVLPSTRALALGPRLTLAASALALFGSGVIFSTLTITVDDERLAWHYGAGLFRKSVPLSEIVSAEPTTTVRLEGWGIHLTTRGWLYNVAGRQAVLVTLRDGKRFMVGTDEPDALVQALHGARGSAT